MKTGDLIKHKGCGGLHLIVDVKKYTYKIIFSNHWKRLNYRYVSGAWVETEFELIKKL